jgi:NADH:ubiquinone oxidoreductase subunit H
MVADNTILFTVAAGVGATTSTYIGKNKKSSEIFGMLTEINAVSDVRYGLLVILALSSLSVYGLIIAG